MILVPSLPFTKMVRKPISVMMELSHLCPMEVLSSAPHSGSESPLILLLTSHHADVFTVQTAVFLQGKWLRCPPAQLDQGPASQDAPSSHSSLRFCSGKEQVPLKGPQHFEPFINLRMHSLIQGLPLWPCLSSLLPLPHRFLLLQERPS